MMDSLLIKRGREFFIKNDGSGFEPVQEGTFTATLLNVSGTYDPYNVDSELYPYVRPGVKFRLRVKDNNTGTLYDVIAGRIEDIKPVTGNVEKVRITGVDAIKELKNTKAFIPLFETIGIDDAVDTLLDGISWADGRYIQATSDAIPYWWSPGLFRNAYQELVDLADEKFGIVFISGNGYLKFYNAQNPSTGTVQLTSSEILRDMQVTFPWETVRNAIRININSLTLVQGVDVWTLQGQLWVGAGETRSFDVQLSYNGQKAACLNFDTLVTGTSYTANTQADGNGTDLTANFSLSLSPYGETANISITNNSASNGYLTKLIITGDALTQDNTYIVERTDQASINSVRRKEFNLDNRWIQNVNAAENYAEFLTDLLPTPSAYPTIFVKNDFPKQLGVELFDKVDLYFPTRGISGTYYASYIEHQWGEPNGYMFTTKYKFEPSIDFGQYWVFTTQIGVTSIFAF
jgi:hypothetical protein